MLFKWSVAKLIAKLSLRFRKLSTYQKYKYTLCLLEEKTFPLEFNSHHTTIDDYLKDIECLRKLMRDEDFKLIKGENFDVNTVFRDRFQQGRDSRESFQSIKNTFFEVGERLYEESLDDNLKIVFLKSRVKYSFESYIRALGGDNVIQSKRAPHARRARRK